MKHLLNTLFVTSQDAYLALEGETVVVYREKQAAGRFPLHTLSGILSFSYAGASPALMGACAQRGVNLAFCTPRGRFLARAVGPSHGSVLLRRTQYRFADDPAQSGRVARNFLFGKVYNARWSIERTLRDHALRVDAPRLKEASLQLRETLPRLAAETDPGSLRGLEGAAAALYFGVLDDMILNGKDAFFFHGRSRRPGLDSYVGFLHRDRPGRVSLALDLMEELRPCMADRFVLTLINNRMIASTDFEFLESGAVFIRDEARRAFLQAWQAKKQESITHPYLKEKLPWGLVPYIQALLLARYLRGDLDGYPPFLWK